MNTLLEDMEIESKSAIDIAREYFPYECDTELDYIIWNKTGFPSFFRGDPILCFRRQLREYRQAVYNYPFMRLCDFCNAPAAPNQSLCYDCFEIIEKNDHDFGGRP